MSAKDSFRDSFKEPTFEMKKFRKKKPMKFLKLYDSEGITQMLLRSQHFINPSVWYLVLGLNFITCILVMMCYHEDIQWYWVFRVICAKTPSRILLSKSTNFQRRNQQIFVNSMIMREPLSCSCGSIISSIRPFDISPSV